MSQAQAWSSGYANNTAAATATDKSDTASTENAATTKYGRVASSLAIDSYAQTVLQQHSVTHAVPSCDESLGPYVTSLLRTCGIQSGGAHNSVGTLDEYDSLVELLEEHCSMDTEQAAAALQTIAAAVQTGRVPVEEEELSYAYNGSRSAGFDAMETLRTALPESTSTGPGTLVKVNATSTGSGSNGTVPTVTATTSATERAADENEDFLPSIVATATPTAPAVVSDGSFMISPTQADNLIPYDLLGVLDDPSPSPKVTKSLTAAAGVASDGTSSTTTTKAAATTTSQQQQDPFPPLGSSKPAMVSRKRSGGKNSKAKKTSTQSSELKAMLFRPARPRISSIDESSEYESSSYSRSPNVTSQPSPPEIPTTVPAAAVSANLTTAIDQGAKNYYAVADQQLQWNAVVEMLLSMNHDVSEQAAGRAATKANLDINVAQYLVDCAMSAPPVCRHLLNDGCYRSDCTFSHDIVGHTCVFWLRGRCGKGDSCRFLHGFNEQLLQEIAPAAAVATAASSYPLVPPEPQEPFSRPSASGMMHAFDSPQMTSAYSYPGPMGGSGAYLGPSWETATSTPTAPSFSFANIASQGYNHSSSYSNPHLQTAGPGEPQVLPTAKVPQDLWNPHENRDSSVFHIVDPIERYRKVALTVPRDDVIDLHFQSTKTFPVVLSTVLPEKLAQMEQVWIVTGTGHHVGSKTHQKGGGALENAVVAWLTDEGYFFAQGRDRNGQGGASLVNPSVDTRF